MTGALIVAAAWIASAAARSAGPANPIADPGAFPISVWVQDPKNARAFQSAGINLYVGLWKGPTEEQLAALAAADMPVVCEQNAVGLAHRDDPVIAGWMHGDEPDNAQSLGEGKEGYGPPIPPGDIVASYTRLRAADPTRPILLNLGQGVAWDGWYGRGVRTNHPEDYAEYVKGCDIASFDIYPVVHDHADIAGRLEKVPFGVDRLRGWAGPTRPVWACIEASRIGNLKAKPTAAQIRAEVWMAVIHGARGLIYFVHQFAPNFIEASLLEDPALLAGVTALNREITGLAPVLAAGPAGGLAGAPDGVSVLVRRFAGSDYVFAARERPTPSQARFAFPGPRRPGPVEVLGEHRSLPVTGNAFTDAFAPYAVHLYRLPAE